MKKKLSNIALAGILLVSVLASLSCTDVPQNKAVVNAPANNSVVQNNFNKTEPGISDADCSGDPTVKKKKIKDGIGAKINGYSGLKDQLKKRFDFEPVVDSNGDAVLYIWGDVFTSAGNLDQLNKSYESYVKKGCVIQIVFDKAPGAKELNGGFKFDLCEAPNQVCSDGSCQQACPKEIDNENKNANSNTNKAN